RDPGLHVGRAAAVDPTVAHDAAERVDGPAVAGGDHIEVAVQVHDRIAAGARERADDVDPGMGPRVLRPALGRVVFDGEAELFEAGADRARAVFIELAGRVDRRDADQFDGEVDDFVRQLIDGGENSVTDLRFGEDARHRTQGLRVGGGRGDGALALDVSTRAAAPAATEQEVHDDQDRDRGADPAERRRHWADRAAQRLSREPDDGAGDDRGEDGAAVQIGPEDR